ncbi:MAG TPA: hypothetical protein VKT77_08570 [Chthonomonadaceae bacterium]|nr:hypothetical protein [Chthonomonadaceae bacterium]
MKPPDLALAEIAVAAVLIAATPPIFESLLRRSACVARNFRGDTIPQSFGLAILFEATILLGIDARFGMGWRRDVIWLVTVTAFSALGLLDDVAGDRQVKGLRGHLMALIHGRRVTTGLLKAAGGLAVAALAACLIRPGRPLEIGLAATVIALSANAMNLLDLRPGRACAAFSLCAIPLCAVAVHNQPGRVPELAFVLLPALTVWPRDAFAKVMLGDAGSNLLGAAVGLAIAEYLAPWQQAVCLAVLVALHATAERVSLTEVIERVPALRALDRLTGVR